MHLHIFQKLLLLLSAACQGGSWISHLCFGNMTEVSLYLGGKRPLNHILMEVSVSQEGEVSISFSATFY